jgi:hypothetical protein
MYFNSVEDWHIAPTSAKNKLMPVIVLEWIFKQMQRRVIQKEIFLVIYDKYSLS